MSIFASARRFFTYRPGVPSGVGVGVGGLGLMKPQSDPLYWPVPRNQAVRGTLAALEGGYMKLEQGVTPVSLKGNGADLTGALSLQALAQFQSGKQ